MANNQISNADASLDDYIKGRTHLSREMMNMISDDGKKKMKTCLEEGIPPNIVADLFTSSLNKAMQDHSLSISKKIEEQIKLENYHETVVRQGNGKCVYHKFVILDGKQYAFDHKEFNSERQCRQWLKMRKINIKF